MNVLGDRPGEEWPMLISPDGIGPFAVRYVWFKHQENQEFIDGYFSGTSLRLNMRALTADLQELWRPHNDALREAVDEGAIVWRVKVLNKPNQSIDHVEIWKDSAVLHKFMHTDRDGAWPEEVRTELGMRLRARGFIIKRVAEPYPLIGRAAAARAYTHFVQRACAKDACNIFTPRRM